MVHLFRKLLIRIGKVIPFVLAFIVVLGYVEIIYAHGNNLTIMIDDEFETYYTPLSNFIGNIIYIDWFDVLLVWILCFALELCKYSFRCAYYLLLNMFVRAALEYFYLDNGIVVGLASFMALLGLYCVYGGIKVLTNK